MEHTNADIERLTALISSQTGDVPAPTSVVYGLNALLEGREPAVLLVTVQHRGDDSSWRIIACTDKAIATVEASKPVAQWSWWSEDDADREKEDVQLRLRRIRDLRKINITGQTEPHAAPDDKSLTRSTWLLGFADGSAVTVDSRERVTAGQPGLGEDVVDHIRRHWTL